MSALHCDVLVVGAGPAGSAVAARVADSGREVVLAEALSHPRPKACAEYASPRIAEELTRLGLPAGEWQTDARPLRGMRVIHGRHAVDIGYTDGSGPRPAWGIDRTRFDTRLAAYAVSRGATLLEQAPMNDLRRVGDGWEVRLRSGRRRQVVTARWVIGADGGRSRVARLLGVERAVRAPRRLGLVAHVEGDPELTDHGEMHVGPNHYVGLAPMTDGRLNVAMAVPLEPGGRATDRFEAAIAALPAVAARLAGRRRLTPIRGASPIGHRVATPAGPGWLLVGDAAGFIDPFTGEGIFRALRSARAAADALAGGDAGAEERYITERRRAFAAKDALTWTVQAMLAARPIFGYTVRRLAARPSLAARLGSALGDCRPASDALSPAFLAAVLRP